MPEYDSSNLGVIDVSKVISLYLVIELEDMSKEGIFKILGQSIGDVAEMKGKAIEDITVGVIEVEGGPMTEVNIIFSSKDIDIEVLNEIIEAIEGMPPVNKIEEGIVTSHLNETSKRVKERLGYVG